jgi:hypothetical protein
MKDDGTCPTCGEQIVEAHDHDEKAADEKAPWHFKLMIATLVVYLTWRFIQIFT